MSAAEPKILQFIESGGPGGAERAVVALSEALRELGIPVHALTLRTGWLTAKLDERGIPRSRIETVRRLDAALPVRIARLIREHGIELVHSHLLDSNFYGALAARLAGVPHLATEHGDVHHIKRKQFVGLKLRIIGALGSSFASVARHTAQRMIDLGAPAERIVHCKNPLALNSTPAVNRSEIRQSLGVADGAWVWINVANLRPVKNHELLLRAYKHALSAVERPQHLLLIGDGPECERLLNLTRDLGLQGRVSFLGFRDDTQQLLGAADAFALSSLSEAMPMSVMEAAALGLPLVCTEVGGMPEIAAAGVARLVPSQNVEKFAQAMAETVAHGDALQAAARLKAASVRADYSAQSVAREYLEHYRALLRKRGL